MCISHTLPLSIKMHYNSNIPGFLSIQLDLGNFKCFKEPQMSNNDVKPTQ